MSTRTPPTQRVSVFNMNFGSLFAGIGGIDLGLERAGMTCLWQVEIDEFCLRVLEKHWPDIQKFGDVKDVGRHNLTPVELIVGGFPCQPHSVGGKRRGAEDDRNLWPVFSRVIAELKPQYVLAENVPGIITTYLDTVLSDLESKGYACATFNIPACAFDAPHNRGRIFIVAHSMCEYGEKYLSRSKYEGTSKAQKIRSNHFERDWRTAASELLRMDDGFPDRVDRKRIGALGNVVVPQVAEWIGRRIIEHSSVASNDSPEK